MITGSYRNILAAAVLIITAPCLCCAGLGIGFGGSGQPLVNFTDEGFISGDDFQVILRGFPKKNAKTLVEQRKTARENAAGSIENAPALKLAEHICAPSAYTELAATIELFKKYEKYGSIYEEFYLIDNSITIVYRFHKNGLKKDIESIPCGGK